MSSAGRSASRSARASERSLEHPSGGGSGGSSRRRPASSTALPRVSNLSTKVEDCLDLVDNLVDGLRRRAYLPTSAPLLRPVDG